MKNIRFREQRYSACALIAAINARIYLGRPDVPEIFFEYLVDLTRGRYGACLSVKKSYPYLRVGYTDGPWSLEWIESHLPVEISTIDNKYGYHASLVINVEHDKLRLVNHYKKVFSWNEILNISLKWEHQRRTRSFRLIKE